MTIYGISQVDNTI